MRPHSRFCVPSQELEHERGPRPAERSENGSTAASEPRRTPFAESGLQGPCHLERRAPRPLEVTLGRVEQFELAPFWVRFVAGALVLMFAAVLAAALATGLIELALWLIDGRRGAP